MGKWGEKLGHESYFSSGNTVLVVYVLSPCIGYSIEISLRREVKARYLEFFFKVEIVWL
jgi:hypothetical protein